MNLPLGLLLLLSTLAYVSVGIAVGIRLVRLARRTHGFPERMLGIACLSGPGLLAPCLVVVHALAEPEWVVRAAAFVGQVGYALFCSVMVLFTWQCFRPDEAWARWLARASIVVVVFAAGGGMARALGLAPVLELRDMDHWTYRAIGFASLLGHAWTGLESFTYYRRMRRRSALGLADPVVTNRFLLWGIGIGAAGVGSVVSLAAQLATGNAMAEMPGLMLSNCLHGLTAAVLMWIAFLPPAAWKRYVLESAGRL